MIYQSENGLFTLNSNLLTWEGQLVEQTYCSYKIIFQKVLETNNKVTYNFIFLDKISQNSKVMLILTALVFDPIKQYACRTFVLTSDRKSVV